MASSFCVQEPFTTNVYADIVLRSSDGFDFYVAKVILIMASPTFKDMFSLPQPPQSTGGTEPPHLSVIDITEPGIIVDALLRCIYPAGDPILPVELTPGVVLAAQKYEIQRAIKCARNAVHTLRSGDGHAVLQAYVLACNHHFEDEAQLAAWKSLRYPLLGESFVHSLSSASGRASVNLFEYHNDVGKRMEKLFSEISELPEAVVNSISCVYCSGKDERRGSNRYRLPEWWTKIRDDMTNGGRIRNGISGPLSTSCFSMEYFMRQFGSVQRCESCYQRVICKDADKTLYNLLRLEMENAASQVAFKLPWEDTQ